MLPIRAPAGGAALSFSVWRKGSTAGRREEIFRASLAGALKVLPRQDRLAWECGVTRLPENSDRADRNWFFTPVAPEKLPTEAWMYDNLDLLALGAGAFERIPPESRAALKQWILGGGRVLIISPDALLGATRENWLPLPAETASFPTDWAMWRKLTGLNETDVQRDRRGQPVWAKFRLGLGGGIFFFPSASQNAVAEEGARTLDQPILIKERSLRPDPRVWSQAYDFFGSNLISATRRENAARWAALGLLGFSAALYLTQRANAAKRPLFNSLFALGFTGLLCSLLARQFLAPELTHARMAVAELSGDARAERHSEYAYFEGPSGYRNLNIVCPPDAALMPLYFRPDEIMQSAVDWSRNKETGGLEALHRAANFNPPAPLYTANRTQELILTKPAEEWIVPLDPSQGKHAAPNGWTPARLTAFFGRTPRGWAFVPANGAPEIFFDAHPALATPRAQPVGADQPLESLLKTALPSLSVSEHTARDQALNWLLERTKNRGREYLIYFDDWESRKQFDLEATLIHANGMRLEPAGCFGMYLLEVHPQ